MCLAIPGKIVKWLEREPPFATASVEFGGVRRKVSMDCVPDAHEGDYVLVHAGIAISRVDPEEAERVFTLLDEIAIAEELGPNDTNLADRTR
jgi:hydrogenase expression/formation protein HypC